MAEGVYVGVWVCGCACVGVRGEGWGEGGECVLVCEGEWMYVVGDIEILLGVFEEAAHRVEGAR